MTVTVVALGDSFSCGEGVGLDIRAEQTWTALLCSALPGARLVNLSTAGARVRDVRRHQLPAALAAKPQLATIMVGLNDVIRSGLTPEQVGDDIQVLVRQLYDDGATVLIARWHDPGVVLGVPPGLRRALALRLAWVNEAVDAAAIATPRSSSRPGSTGDLDVVVGSAARSGQRTDNNVKITQEHRPQIVTLDLGCIPELTDPGAWAVDGVHPSPAGHRAIALSATRVLARTGLPGLQIPVLADLLPMPPGPGRARRARWLLSRGLPWLAQHSGRVAPAVLSMVTQAIRDQRPMTPPADLAIACPLVAQEFGSRLGAVEGTSSQALPGRRVAGIGKGSRAPEVAGTAR